MIFLVLMGLRIIAKNNEGNYINFAPKNHYHCIQNIIIDVLSLYPTFIHLFTFYQITSNYQIHHFLSLSFFIYPPFSIILNNSLLENYLYFCI